VATNEPIFHLAGDTEHRESYWNYVNREKLLIRLPELSCSKQEELAKRMMNLALRITFVHAFRVVSIYMP
jgi:hypothetical protein